MKKQNLSVRQGSTFTLSVAWEGRRLVYRPISQIEQTSPVRITALAHGVPDGWMVAVMNAKGLTHLNAEYNPPKDAEFRQATVVSPDAIEFNPVNAAGFKAYQSGGQLVYYEPVSLIDVTARMQIRRRPGVPFFYELTTENGAISLDFARSRINLQIPAGDTAGMDWTTGFYDLEVVDANGVVTPLLAGEVVVTREITT